MSKFSLFTKLFIAAVCALFLLLGLSGLSQGNYFVALGSGVIVVLVGFFAWIGDRSLRFDERFRKMTPEQRRQATKVLARWAIVVGLIGALFKIVAMLGHH